MDATTARDEAAEMVTRARQQRRKLQWDGSINLNTVLGLFSLVIVIGGGLMALGREGEKIDGLYGSIGDLKANVTVQVNQLTARVDRIYESRGFTGVGP